MRSMMTMRDAVLLSLALMFVLTYALLAGPGFPLDDSWIHQSFARNLALRGEWALIPGEPTAASTAPLYTVLLSVGYRLGVAYPLWTHLMGALALGFTAVAGANLARRFAIDHPSLQRRSRVLSWSAGLAIVACWHLIWAGAAGMETALFAMWTLIIPALGLAAAQAETTSDGPQFVRGLLLGGATALAALTRPEGVLLGGLVALAITLVRPGGWRGWFSYGVGAVLGFAVLIAPYLWLNYSLNGGLLPNTAGAKFEQHRIRFVLPLWQRVYELVLAILAGGQILLLPGFALFAGLLARRDDQTRPLWGVLLLWPLALILLYAVRLPAAYQHGRYVMPALPALLVCGVIATAWVVIAAGRRGILARIMSRALALAIPFVFVAFMALGATTYRTDVAIIEAEHVTAAQWMQVNLSEEFTLLATYDVGAIGFFAPRPLVDLAGLVTPEVIPILNDEAALWDYLWQQHATHIFGFPNQLPGRNADDPRLCPIYTTDAEITRQVGEPNMTLYEIAYDTNCASESAIIKAP